jgi:hypothetical protein
VFRALRAAHGPTPSSDDLEALALAVREAARAPAGSADTEQGRPSATPHGDTPPRRGHLRAVTETDI